MDHLLPNYLGGCVYYAINVGTIPLSEGLNFASNDSLLCGDDLCSDVILTIV